MPVPPSDSSAPNPLDIYILVIGILLGILLGPAVLGRLRPDLYHRYFFTVWQAQEQFDQRSAAVNADRTKKIADLASTGVTDVALNELTAKLNDQLRPYVAQLASSRRTEGVMLALITAVLFVMVLEAVLAPRSHFSRAHLTSARYTLLALWLALVIAQPAYFQELSVSFLGVLIILTLAIALIPRNPRNSQKSQNPPSPSDSPNPPTTPPTNI